MVPTHVFSRSAARVAVLALPALVWTLLALTVLCWLPLSDRWERRHPFGFAAGMLAAGLALHPSILIR